MVVVERLAGAALEMSPRKRTSRTAVLRANKISYNDFEA